MKEKPTHSIKKTTAAISNSKGESLAWTGHFDIAVGGGKLGGLLEAKNAIKTSRLGLECSERYALYLELASVWRVFVPVGDCVLFASKRGTECGLRLEVFDCFIFSHADSIAYSIGVCRFDLTICTTMAMYGNYRHKDKTTAQSAWHGSPGEREMLLKMARGLQKPDLGNSVAA